MRRRTVVGLLLAAAAWATLVPAAGAARAPHVYGGSAVPDPVPFMAGVSIGYPDGDTAFCGGTLVAARYVVTAAHCVAPDAELGTPSRIVVTLGAKALRDATPQAVAASVVHPAYATLRIASGAVPVNDVAVLRLAAPSGAAPARLPRTGDAALWAPGRTALALGYGLTDDADDKSFAGALRQVKLPIVERSRCGRVYGPGFGAADLCAGRRGRDTCSGDSGGPLLVADRAGTATLVGVTSFGTQCGSTPGAYTAAGGTVNAFLRSVIPQVEIDAPAAAPAGAPLAVSAAASAPGATGPFGGYDALQWDLDADGTFDDAAGATATISPAVGDNRVSALATDAAGDREVRTVVVRGRAPQVLQVGAASARVRGGRFTVAVTPTLAGRVQVSAVRGDRRLGRSGTRRMAAGATRRFTVRLGEAGRRLVRRHGSVRLEVRAVLRPDGGGRSSAVRRKLVLRR